jgi:hypothetical protein
MAVATRAYEYKVGDIVMADVALQGRAGFRRCLVVLVHVSGRTAFVRHFDDHRARRALFVRPSILNGLPSGAYLRAEHYSLNKGALKGKVGILDPALDRLVLPLAAASPKPERPIQDLKVERRQPSRAPVELRRTEEVQQRVSPPFETCIACGQPLRYSAYCRCS